MDATSANQDAMIGHKQLVDHLLRHSIPYREMQHSSEGRTELVSKLRGNRLSQAAKAMIICVKLTKNDRKYANVIVPGNCQVNFEAVAKFFQGKQARLAQPEIAKQLTGCEMGTVPPFSFHPDLVLIVDPKLLLEEEIVFNAGRLDTSFFMKREEFVLAANPRVAEVSVAVNERSDRTRE